MLNIPGLMSTQAHVDIAAHLAALGIEPPADIVYAVEVDRALYAAANPHPVAELRAAIARRDTPAKVAAGTTKAATQAAVAQAVEATHRDARRDLDRLARTALLAAGDELIATLQPMFDESAIAVAASIEMLGADAPGPDVLRRPKLAAVWGEARAAHERFDLIRVVRTDLADVGYGTPTESASWYVTRADDLDGPLKATALIEAGVAVRLNTAAESAALTAHRDAEAARKAADRAAKRDREAATNPVARAWARAERQARTLAGPPPRDAA